MIVKILSPVGEKKRDAAKKEELAPRPTTLADKVIGIVDDGAGKAYFQRIEELLSERVKPAQIIRKVKPHLSQPSPVQLLDEVVKICHAVIVGVGI